MDTDLIEAAKDGNLEVLELLLQQGANIDIQNNNGNTALIWAARNDRLEVVKLLLQQGANPDLRDNHGSTFFDYLSQDNKKEFEEIIDVMSGIYIKGDPS